MGDFNHWCFISSSWARSGPAKKPMLLTNQGTRTWTRPFLLSPAEAHFLGYCAITIGLLFAALYLYTRCVMAREKRAPPPRFLESEK
jgi:hypothetical protein